MAAAANTTVIELEKVPRSLLPGAKHRSDAHVASSTRAPSQQQRSGNCSSRQKRFGFAAFLALGCLFLWGVLLRVGTVSTCMNGRWPLFDTPAQLAANVPWAAYFASVYGHVPSSAFPLCVGDLWMFYTDLLDVHGVDIPAAVGACPIGEDISSEGQLYIENSRLSPANTSWSWHPARYDGGRFEAKKENTWVEVLHQGGIEDEHIGAWFLYAGGSGVSINTGRTIAFDDHNDAHVHFGVTHLPMKQRNERMCANASAAGYDTIQFVAHTCGMMYAAPGCLNTSDPTQQPRLFNLEIVATKLIGFHPCASADGRSAGVRSGWGGVKACSCNNSRGLFLHCEEVPASAARVLDGPRWRATEWGRANMMMRREGAMASGHSSQTARADEGQGMQRGPDESMDEEEEGGQSEKEVVDGAEEVADDVAGRR